MKSKKNLWGVILAAGEGTRLRSLTLDEEGTAVPKQYCSFSSNKSMIRSALERAEKIIPEDHIVVIVAAEHERWWRPELADLPEENILVQPDNRGTAVGILLPVMTIMVRDPDAKLLVMPSDHYVEEEDILAEACERAIELLGQTSHKVILLGITPDTQDAEYGWIIPLLKNTEAISGVSYFVEKPGIGAAEKLMEQGGLWNSFMFVANGTSLISLYKRILPDTLQAFLAELKSYPMGWDVRSLERLYRRLPNLDFSRDLLEYAVDDLCVLPVPSCGWSDLGTPDRVFHCLNRFGRAGQSGLSGDDDSETRPIKLPPRDQNVLWQ